VNAALTPIVPEPSSPGVQICTDPESSERCLRARVAFAPGDVLVSFGARMTHLEPARLTVQVDERCHIELDPSWLSYLEHGCAPNVALDLTGGTSGRVVCLLPIAVGDVLTYFYPSTEWDMAAPFVCRCGAAACLGVVTGAARLALDAPEVLRRHWLAPHIVRRLPEMSVRLAG